MKPPLAFCEIISKFQFRVDFLFFSGIALEKFKAAGESNIDENEITKCFERAGEIALWIFMEEQRLQADKKSSMTPLLNEALTKPGDIYVSSG